MSDPQRSQKMSKSTSERVYEKLLAACPKEFREDHGPQMMQSFGDLRKEERYRGRLGLTRLWRRTLPDLALTAISERSKTMGRAMSGLGRYLNLKSLMVLNGILLIIFGACFIGPPGPRVMMDLYEVPAPAFRSVSAPSTFADLSFGRMFGIVCVILGALLAAVSPAVEKGLNLILSGTLFLTYGLGFLMALIQQQTIWTWSSVAGWATLIFFLLFTIGYGIFWLIGAGARQVSSRDNQVHWLGRKAG